MWNDRSAASAFFTLAIGLSVNACSLAVDAGREQCVNDSDCARLGSGFADGVCVTSLCSLRPDPVWGCLDEASAAPAAPVPERVRIIVPFVDVVTGQRVPNVEVQACERLDTYCQSPLATGTSNPEGQAELRLPGGFNGYLRWQASNIYPTMFFFGLPITADAVFPVDVISPQVFAGLNAQFTGAIEGRSAVVVNVKNCSGSPGAGVSLSIPEGDDATRIFYMVDGLFPQSQTETTVAGLARLINVPEGQISITGTLADGREIGTAAVLTHPAFATLTNLRPTLSLGN